LESTAQNSLIVAARKILLPLVKLLLSQGIKLQQLNELVKSVYVEAAILQEQTNGATGNNLSQISVATGIHRKDLKRLIDELEAGVELQANTVETEVFTKWRATRDWCDKKGNPSVLTRAPTEGRKSFDELVRSVTTDVHPRAIFDAMHRLELVSVDTNGELRLNASAFVPKTDLNKMMAFLGDNIGDHLTSVQHNIQGLGEPLIEQSVFIDELTRNSANDLHAFSREQWVKLLANAVKEGERVEALDKKVPRELRKFRARIGLYFFTDAQNTLKAPNEKTAKVNAKKAERKPK
jgi:Family of unknown function (DUF6502)